MFTFAIPDSTSTDVHLFKPHGVTISIYFGAFQVLMQHNGGTHNCLSMPVQSTGTPPQNFKLVFIIMHCVYFIYILIYFFENQTCLFVHYWDVIRPLDFTRWMLIHNQRGLHFQLSWGIPSSYATQRWDPHEPVHACPKYGTPPQNFKLVYNTMHCVYFIYILIYFFENQTCLFVHYWDVIRPLDFTRWMLIHNQRGLHFQLSWGIPSSYATQWWDIFADISIYTHIIIVYTVYTVYNIHIYF